MAGLANRTTSKTLTLQGPVAARSHSSPEQGAEVRPVWPSCSPCHGFVLRHYAPPCHASSLLKLRPWPKLGGKTFSCVSYGRPHVGTASIFVGSCLLHGLACIQKCGNVVTKEHFTNSGPEACLHAPSALNQRGFTFARDSRL